MSNESNPLLLFNSPLPGYESKKGTTTPKQNSIHSMPTGSKENVAPNDHIGHVSNYNKNDINLGNCSEVSSQKPGGSNFSKRTFESLKGHRDDPNTKAQYQTTVYVQKREPSDCDYTRRINKIFDDSKQVTDNTTTFTTGNVTMRNSDRGERVRIDRSKSPFMRNATFPEFCLRLNQKLRAVGIRFLTQSSEIAYLS